VGIGGIAKVLNPTEQAWSRTIAFIKEHLTG